MIITSTMTIKVEREALLRLLASKPTTTTTLSTTTDCHPEYQYVSIQKPAFSTVPGRIRDDDDSVYTNSTASLSSDADDDRRVSFTDPLVTEVWTREYTSKDEIWCLYYSTEETQRWVEELRRHVDLYVGFVLTEKSLLFLSSPDLLFYLSVNSLSMLALVLVDSVKSIV
jgi:hypothetical protein